MKVKWGFPESQKSRAIERRGKTDLQTQYSYRGARSAAGLWPRMATTDSKNVLHISKGWKKRLGHTSSTQIFVENTLIDLSVIQCLRTASELSI